MSAQPTSSTLSSAADADVLIVGAGPAGLALACALDAAGISSLLLEQQDSASLSAPPEDGRDIALTHRARQVMQQLGLWQRLPSSSVAPLREARVLDGEATSFLQFGAKDGHSAGQPLGWLVPNHLIRQAAHDEARSRAKLRIECGARVTALALNDDMARVSLADGRSLQAPLVVAADSRFSETRRRAGIGAAMRDFGRTVIVARVAHEGDNQGIAWECFRYGNTLALLPMNGGQCSAVITARSDQAASWLALDDAGFAERVQQQAGSRLGALRTASARHAYPLVAVYAHRFTAQRFALVGDAAVGMHPVTAHGYNFGLYGVQVLARELAAARRAGTDLGAGPALQRYDAEHRRVTLPIYLGTNAIVSLFTDERTPAKALRKAVLTVAERVPPFSGLIRRAITRQLTGEVAAA
ncbi:Ubiquinone biosynthesis hydroxylase, UbiH/UbiF/VisC/COQ6 family [Burkholderiales bacterium JOSHI_001]|nr:Ubiquinone biosynthesis hydroxylase, UbiH/UbiF/VisC/COQ6 family [Burkholderiales bacterium JOSHI_001]